MRTPVEPGVTVDDVPSRRGAPPPPRKRKSETASKMKRDIDSNSKEKEAADESDKTVQSRV